MDIIQRFNSTRARQDLPELKPGLNIKVHQKIKDGAKTRTQIFEGLIIAHKHGTSASSTITVRKVSNGIGVERIFPLHSPTIEKFEVIKANKVRRAKLYYIREKTAYEARRKIKAISPGAKKTTAPTSEPVPATETE